MGRPAMFRNELPDVCFTNTLIRFRASDIVDPNFAILVFRHYMHSGVFSRVAKITTNLAHLGVRRFAALPFPIPPLKEQQTIAQAVNLRLGAVERLKARLGELSTIALSLEITLRREALSGRLVAQVATEESAADGLALVRKDELLSTSERRAKPGRKIKVTRIVPIVEALRKARRPLTGQELFSEAGYPTDAQIEVIEQFFLELRSNLERSLIKRTKHGDNDYFELRVDL